MGASKDKKTKLISGKLFLKKYLKYKNKYTTLKNQRGGSDLTFTEEMSNNKLQELITIIGNPNLVERENGNLYSATWKNNSNLPYIKLFNKPAKKYHPIPAVVFIIVGKYLKVPDRLIGPLKYASETINIEQLFVNPKAQEHYFETGEKLEMLVTGSCASLTISAITVAFVEDMIETYKNSSLSDIELMNIFRKEYDDRIRNYLCSKGLKPISWFKPEDYNEESIFTMNQDVVDKYCKN
jgi:hypothetical protein